MHVQELFSSEGCFLMGDGQREGFPIIFASKGFEQTYGYATSEILGRHCGEALGCAGILASPGSLANAAALSGLTTETAEARLRFLNDRGTEAVREMLGGLGRIGAAYLPNRKKSGALFVCEFLVINLKHTSTGCAYCVGFQRDVSRELTMRALLEAAACPERYAALMRARRTFLEVRRSALAAAGQCDGTTNLARAMGGCTLASALCLDTGRRGQASPATPALEGHEGGGSSPAAAGAVAPSRLADGAHSVVDFLRGAGLGQYADSLVSNGFDDMETLLEIEDTDMKDLGMARGHVLKLRKRLQKLKALQDSVSSSASTVSTADTEVPDMQCSPSQEPLGTALGAQPRQAAQTAVERSWAQVQALGIEHVGMLLFRNLFELDPTVELLFPPAVQEKYRDKVVCPGAWSSWYDSPGVRKVSAKVLNILGCAVAGVHDAHRLVPMLVQLGGRHVGYGLKVEHLDLLSKALVRTLRECLFDLFTPEVELAWTVVCSFVCASITEGLGGMTWPNKVQKVVVPSARPAPGFAGMLASKALSPLAPRADETVRGA